jgi:hypothetical protein
MLSLEKLCQEIEQNKEKRKQDRIARGCIVIQRPASCIQKGGCACYALDSWICKDRLGYEYSEEPVSETEKKLVQSNLFF